MHAAAAAPVRAGAATRGRVGFLAAVLVAPLLAGCHALWPNEGGGTAEFRPPRAVEPRDVLLPAGYRIEAVATGLTYPTGVAFDGQGRPHVVESGYSYGESFTSARLLRVEPGGALTPVASGDQVPWTGVAFHGGAFYVASGGQVPGKPQTGRILRVRPETGTVATVLDDLPGHGDHHTNGPVAGPDGWLYFAQGTATNSGVVGPDNWKYGWLTRRPEYHDIPCQGVRLTGEVFASDDPRGDGRGRVSTGAFAPFGTAVPGGVVRGRFPCHGAVMRVRPEGGRAELVAWGFRNPFGLAFAPDGALFATDHAYDERGSRPVFGAGDVLWRVERGRWYGWPDFHAGTPLDAGSRYSQTAKTAGLRRVLAEPLPGQPPPAAAVLAVHAGASGLDAAPASGAFGPPGRLFVAEFGDQTPEVGKVMAPVGYRISVVDPRTGTVETFAANRGRENGPASWGKHGGLERPLAVRFDPAGQSLWVVDFGVLMMREGAMIPVPGTGVVWRITRAAAGER